MSFAYRHITCDHHGHQGAFTMSEATYSCLREPPDGASDWGRTIRRESPDSSPLPEKYLKMFCPDCASMWPAP